jgi:spermidine synthase
MVIGSRIAVAPSGPERVSESQSAKDSVPASSRHAVLLVMAVSGMAALALEAVWMRVLVQSFSATVYSFSIMLACFLFGLYYGSARVADRVDGELRPLEKLAGLQYGIGFSVAAIAVLAYAVPKVFSNFLWLLAGLSSGNFAVASVIAQFLVASVLILGPTMMLGAMFPYGVRAVTHDIERRAAGTGIVYAANTTGAVIGSLLAAFALLPAFGTRGALLVIALMFAVSGLILQGGALTRRQLYLLSGIAAVIALMLPRQTVANYGLQRTTDPELVYHGDGVSHSVDIVKNERHDTIMMINGNVEADTSFIQRRHFILKAYLPLLLHRQPRNVAVIGLGLGITLSATARYPGVRAFA